MQLPPIACLLSIKKENEKKEEESAELIMQHMHASSSKKANQQAGLLKLKLTLPAGDAASHRWLSPLLLDYNT